jgi:hypothetical protein
MGEKVSWYPLTKIVQITKAPVDVSGEDQVNFDVKIDLYSDGKEDWMASGELNKFEYPVQAIGGQSLPGERELGTTFFLNYGWRIRPYEESHVFNVNGNLYTDTGDSPFTQTVGTYNIMTIQQVSSLVDSTVAQLEEIQYASFNGGVSVDLTSSYSGTTYPTGTPQEPVNNFVDALTIASERGFTTFYVIGDATVDSSQDYRGYIFVGESQTKTELDIDTNAQVDGCEFYDATVVGTLDGDAKLKNCTIGTLNYINGIIEQCLLEIGTITLGGAAEAHFLDCWSGVAGTNTPIIDMGGSGQELSVRNYNGGIKLVNKSGVDSVSMDINSGHVILDSTVVSGEIVIRGVGKLTDNAGPNTNVVIQDYLNPRTIADQTWDEATADHTASGSFGEAISDTDANLLRAIGLMQENYYLDQTVYTTYNGAKLLTSGRLRTYTDAGSVGTSSNVLATYTISASWSNDELSTYQVVKQ